MNTIPANLREALRAWLANILSPSTQVIQNFRQSWEIQKQMSPTTFSYLRSSRESSLLLVPFLSSPHFQAKTATTLLLMIINALLSLENTHTEENVCLGHVPGLAIDPADADENYIVG